MLIKTNDELFGVILAEVYAITVKDSSEKIPEKLVSQSKWGNTKYAPSLKKLCGPYEMSLFIAYLKDKYNMVEDFIWFLDSLDDFDDYPKPFFNIFMSIAEWAELSQNFDACSFSFNGSLNALSKLYNDFGIVSDFVNMQRKKGQYRALINEGTFGFLFYNGMRFVSYAQALHWVMNTLFICRKIGSIFDTNDYIGINCAEIYKKSDSVSRIVLHNMIGGGTKNIHLPRNEKNILKEYESQPKLNGVLTMYKDALIRLFGRDIIVLAELKGTNYCIRQSSKLTLDELPENQRSLIKNLIYAVVYTSEKPVKQIILDLTEDSNIKGILKCYTGSTILGKEKAVDVFLGWSMNTV